MPLGNEKPSCEVFRCHNDAIGMEMVHKNGWFMRLCKDHATPELLVMRKGQEFDDRKDYRYRYLR